LLNLPIASPGRVGPAQAQAGQVFDAHSSAPGRWNTAGSPNCPEMHDFEKNRLQAQVK